jgi:hypothetical protein
VIISNYFLFIGWINKWKIPASNLDKCK